jgi:hypothetical protein
LARPFGGTPMLKVVHDETEAKRDDRIDGELVAAG